MSLINAPLPREQDQEATRDRFRLRRILLGMAFLSLMLAAIFGRHGVLDVQRYRAERDRLKTEIAQMEDRRRALEAEVPMRRRLVVSTEAMSRRTDDGIEIRPVAEFFRRLWAGELTA